MKCGVPDHTVEGFIAYVFDGIPPGDFLWAVLTNDLIGAFGRADGSNINAMKEIVDFVYNFLPVACYGTPAKVHDWLIKSRQTEKTQVIAS